jgi:hypothetical protein
MSRPTASLHVGQGCCLNRVLGVLAVGLMILANTALFLRDVYPAWTAGLPPTLTAEQLAQRDRQQLQVGIFDQENRRVGTSWTETRRAADMVLTESFTRLDVIRAGEDILTPELVISSRVYVQADGRLDRFSVQVEGFGQIMELRGKYLPPEDFPCEWQVGEQKGTFNLPAAATRSMGDAIQPIRQLGRVQVGQSWRIEIFDPLSGTLPGLLGQGLDTNSIVVRVSDIVNIEHQGETRRVFLLESDHLRAWVADDTGQALRQEVTLPLLGRFRLEAEPFSFEAREEARYRQFRSPD